MNILVDADACPVKEIIVDVAKEYSVPVIMFVDTSHILKSDYAKIVTVDKDADSADIKLINYIKKGDIAVTQDYGVAAMALGKGAYVINQNGMIYDGENIDRLLFERHIGKKLRRAGKKTSSVKKRCTEDDDKFRMMFISLLRKAKMV